MRRLNLARLIAAVAALSLFIASLIHFGYFIEGYTHRGAAVPEAVIGAVMVVALTLSWTRVPWGRRALIGGLGFGLAGSTLGLVLVVIGVGPQTTPDIVDHVLLVTGLVIGLFVAATSGSGVSTN